MKKAEKAELEIISADAYYGKTYDDMQNRLPSVEKMELLGWKPRTGMRELLNRTISWYADGEKSGLKKLAIKVDIDTLRGYREGVPQMLDLFKKHGIRASIFFLSFGPDNFRKSDQKDIPKGLYLQNR